MFRHLVPIGLRRKALEKIRHIFFDVDGVLTTGELYFDADGECIKVFNSKDGIGLQLLDYCDIKYYFVSGRDSMPLRHRLDSFSHSGCFLGVNNKVGVVQAIIAKTGCCRSQTAFVGDDLIDLNAMQFCGTSFCPNDAASDVRKVASIILKTDGGKGVVRDVAELLFRYQKPRIDLSSSNFISSFKTFSQ